ncbi:MAG: hypothetical protein WCD57_25280 [Acidobacteriaceae bacterium]
MRAEIVADHLDFLQRILIGEINLRARYQQVIVCLTVQLRIIGTGAQTIRRVVGSVGLSIAVAVCGNDAWRQKRRGVESSIYREFLECFGFECGSTL